MVTCISISSDDNSVKQLKKQVLGTLEDQHIVSWKREIPTISRLKDYPRYKAIYGTEKYVKYIANRKYRSLITKLRCDTLPINVEIGRYRNIERKDRLCCYCTLNQVEDRAHLLFTCPLYKDHRALFLNDITFTSDEPTEMLIELLSKDNVYTDTAKFMSNVMLQRAKAD